MRKNYSRARDAALGRAFRAARRDAMPFSLNDFAFETLADAPSPATTPSTIASEAPPHWDMTVVYPSLDSPEFARGFDEVIALVAALDEIFDRNNICGEGVAENPATGDVVRAYEEATNAFNTTLNAVRTLRAYISSFVATDSRNLLAQARQSELQGKTVALSLLSTRYTAWLGTLDADALITASPLARDHAFYIHEAKVAASHLLSPAEESLAATLGLSGGTAWAKLHGDITSQITVPLSHPDGTTETHPMSVIRALASDPSRDVRKQAYEAELAAWETVAVPLAAAMNSIKHESGTLAVRRGWGSPLDSALFYNHIDRETLDAMMTAAEASFPVFRRYLQTKARLVSGANALPWYDLFAPVGGATEGAAARSWSWAEAEDFVADNFGAYSPKMADFARRTFRGKWIDAEPRPGKRDGAFCMGLRGDESRIAQNYKPAFGGVSTLAHELGHAYHNTCLAHRTPLQRGTPMTLAETASIFCETIVRQAALGSGSVLEQASILEATLQSSCQVVVDIASRFRFEQTVFARRPERELSVSELCKAMLESQRETYGDGMDADVLHPYMWAVKSHYYGSSFYNYPYMFGLLFATGLYAIYQQDPVPFQSRYDELLSLTGMEDAATLAGKFGINLRDTDFWAASLAVLARDVDRFEAVAPTLAK